MSKIYNAKLTNWMIGYEDHGIFTYSLTFEYQYHQCGGGRCLWSPTGTQDYTGILIRGLLKVFKVDNLQLIKDKYCRIKLDKDFNGQITHVGHIIDEVWVEFANPQELLEVEE